MSKSIYKSAEKMATRVMEFVELYHRIIELNVKYDTEFSMTLNGFVCKNHMYYCDLLPHHFRGCRRGSELQRKVQYIRFPLTNIAKWKTEIYTDPSGSKSLIVNLNNDVVKINDKIYSLHSTFNADFDFQLSMMMNNRDLKTFYLASILYERGFSGTIKLDDTIVFTNMLRCMRDEVHEYERIGKFRTGSYRN